MNAKTWFFCFRPEIPFLSKFDTNNQNFDLKWNLIIMLIRICRIQGDVHFFSFWPEIPFLDKFEKKNCQFKLKFVGLIGVCRIQWWCSLFLFSTRNTFFWVNLIQKIKIVSLEFSTYTYLDMQYSMVVYLFCVFNWKHSFWANLVQQIRIISLSWNVAPGLIQTYRIYW